MQISESAENGVILLVPQGRIDGSTAEPFKQKLLATISDSPIRMVIDFAQVDFISSIGLRVLVVTAKRIAAVRGKMAFCNVNGSIREVFDLAGFTAVAALFPD